LRGCMAAKHPGGATTMSSQRCSPRTLAAAACALLLLLGKPPAANAEDEAAAASRQSGGFPELESKYIFGSFTRGASVGEVGERAIEPDTVANFGHRAGLYTTTETELELEYTPTKFLQIEIGPTISYYNIRGVPGLEDRSNTGGLNGINGTIRSLLIEHGQSPLAVTLSVEPMWHSLNETSGAAVSTYGLETKIEADAELIKDRLFYAFNALYAPETTIAEDAASTWHPEATLGLSSALAFQVIPNVVIGADLWYLRHYDSLGTGSFTGDAVYLGPTFFWKVSPKMLISASWEAQVAGRESVGASSLDLTDFSRQRARLLVEFDF
jgi:hypothetical protein